MTTKIHPALKPDNLIYDLPVREQVKLIDDLTRIYSQRISDSLAYLSDSPIDDFYNIADMLPTLLGLTSYALDNMTEAMYTNDFNKTFNDRLITDMVTHEHFNNLTGKIDRPLIFDYFNTLTEGQIYELED